MAETMAFDELVDSRNNPIPQGARVGVFETQDKAQLRYAYWLPSYGRYRGTICVCQGRGEYIEKYFETINQLRVRGFAVATFDWRGQGGSQRLNPGFRGGHIDHFDQYKRDLNDFHRTILLPDCREPYFLIAHSMGALVALLVIMQDRPIFERVMLFAPLFGLPVSPIQSLIIANIAALLCATGHAHMQVGRHKDDLPRAEEFAGNRLTSDFNRYMRMVNVLDTAPQLGVGRPTVGWVNAAFKAMNKVRGDAFATRFNTPMMVLTAGADLVVNNRITDSRLVHWGGTKHVCIANGRHELLMENDAVQAQIYAAIDAFIIDSTGFE